MISLDSGKRTSCPFKYLKPVTPSHTGQSVSCCTRALIILERLVAVSRDNFENGMKTILRLYPLFHSLRLRRYPRPE